ncbi:MAG: hypothetical protein EOP06_05350 [Proteobacteria bacterium]|nr:MAG: hypothetical protein EOP06_05350 [Pseudomonadota bacterium]
MQTHQKFNLNGLSQPDRLFSEYQKLVYSIRSHLTKYGLKKRAFSKNNISRFSELPFQSRYEIVLRLRAYQALCQDGEDCGFGALEDPKALLRFVAFRLRVNTPEDFLAALAPGDIVEIFDFDGEQVYRNINFFEISDYTLDEIFGSSWDLLYERSKSVTKKIFERVEVAAKTRGCIPFDIPEHYMRERCTEERKIVKVRLKYLASLTRDGEAVAWIASSEAVDLPASEKAVENKLRFI